MARLKSNWISKLIRLAIYLRDGFTCVYCRRDLRAGDPFDITLDHLVPRAIGGNNHDPRNLVTSCRSCNSRKGAIHWKQFASKRQKNRIIKTRKRKLPAELAATILLARNLDDE